MKKSLWLITGIYLILAWGCSSERFSTYSLIDSKLQKNHLFKSILDSFSKYESQIIFTQINRDEHNKPIFKSYTWNLKPEFYFYPASMVKMPAALIAVEKINRLHTVHPELNLFTPVRFEAGHSPQTSFLSDSSSWNHQASIGQFIKKIFLVSDNEAFNRTYEFIGQAELNQRLKELGYRHTHIIHRLDAPEYDFEANKYTNPLAFAIEDKMIYQQKEQYNPDDVRITNLESLKKGTDYISNDSTIHKPFDFSKKNYFSLQDMSDMIQSIMFPGTLTQIKPFDLQDEQLQYIRTCMSKLPRESKHPVYDSTHQDGYCKFFMFGDKKTNMPDHIRIFNKVGWAYGYLTDAAYIVDFKNKVEFILAATINCNLDGIYNDGIYEYDSLGLPYLSQLGSFFYNHELERKRKRMPDLSTFTFEYKE